MLRTIRQVSDYSRDLIGRSGYALGGYAAEYERSTGRGARTYADDGTLIIA